METLFTIFLIAAIAAGIYLLIKSDKEEAVKAADNDNPETPKSEYEKVIEEGKR